VFSIKKGNFIMGKNKIKTTVRIEKDILKKMIFIAEFHKWSVNDQIEHIIKKHVNEYEKENGVIITEIMD